ncbi:MAG: IS607 family transposase [Oscillospiraceae bacterium]|nr:IS607 family transposase [Oscillospiraceae bacterium]
MKSKEVLNVLKITRQTLTKYVKNGLIKVEILPNGRYEYDEESVYAFLNKEVKRRTYIYARVSTPKQKRDLENQIKLLKQFCFMNSYTISGIYSDIASGISFEKRKDFFRLLDEIIDNKAERVVITYKDRISRVGFDLFYHLFKKYNCEIVVMSEAGSEKLDRQEIFEEIVSMLHCYSMKLYSKRKIQKIKEVLYEREDEQNHG